jgi:hypothetical protein
MQAGSGTLSARALAERCQLTAQRVYHALRLQFTEFSDRAMFDNFIALLLRRSVVHADAARSFGLRRSARASRCGCGNSCCPSRFGTASCKVTARLTVVNRRVRCRGGASRRSVATCLRDVVFSKRASVASGVEFVVRRALAVSNRRVALRPRAGFALGCDGCARLDEYVTFVGESMADERPQAIFDGRLQRLRAGEIEPQLYGGRDFVDVLPAGPPARTKLTARSASGMTTLPAVSASSSFRLRPGANIAPRLDDPDFTLRDGHRDAVFAEQLRHDAGDCTSERTLLTPFIGSANPEAHFELACR